MMTMITSKTIRTTKNERWKTYFVICLLSFIFLQALPASAIKKIEANPVNIAFMLAQDTDSANMARTCEYYGYTQQPSQNSYTVFTHRNGSTIRYSFKDADKDQPYPYVEVKPKSGSGDIDAVLTNLEFQKAGSLYERKNGRYTRSKFTCRQGAQGFMVFHQSRLPNNR